MRFPPDRFFAVEQYSDKWKKVRSGFPTASCFHWVITPGGKSSDAKERKKYLCRLAAEKIIGDALDPEWYGNENTEHGTRTEAQARSALAKFLGHSITDGGFLLDETKRYGCSVDGMLKGQTEAVEIKCPTLATHIGYMVYGPGFPFDKYRPQVQGHLLVGDFRCVHFWSYYPDPRFPPVHVTTRPEPQYQHDMGTYLDKFCNDLEATTEWVRSKGNLRAVIYEQLRESARG